MPAQRGRSQAVPQDRRRAVIARTIEAFRQHPAIGQDRGRDPSRRRRRCFAAAASGTAAGGASCEAAPRAGNRRGSRCAPCASEAPATVLIHDAVRPFVDAALIDRVIAASDAPGRASGSRPVAETLKRAAADGPGPETVPRAGLSRRADAAGGCFHGRSMPPRTRRRSAAGRTASPTTPQSPNGPMPCGQDRGRLAGQRRSSPGQGISPWPTSAFGRGHELSRTCAPATAMTCTPSSTATTWCCAACDPARQKARRAFRRRRRAACADRCAARHLRRRRHRHAFPAIRSRWQGAASRVFVEHAARWCASAAAASPMPISR